MAEQRFTEAILNDPVGQHARNDFSALQPEWTVAEALAHLRKHPPGGRLIYFYVTAADGKLVGVVPTRRLLLNPLDMLIQDIMVKSVVALPVDATVLEACEFFSLHRLFALPVVDADRRLVGVVDVDLYTDELVESSGEVRDDVFQMIGVHLSQANQQKPWQAAKGRFPWLLCNIGGGLLAAVLSGIFQDVLNWHHAVLALFVPLVLALSESVTIQSVTLVLQGMRISRVSFSKLLQRTVAEAGTGLLLGLGTALLVGSVVARLAGFESGAHRLRRPLRRRDVCRDDRRRRAGPPAIAEARSAGGRGTGLPGAGGFDRAAVLLQLCELGGGERVMTQLETQCESAGLTVDEESHFSRTSRPMRAS